jgi:putative ABC transport system permease protein
LAKRYFANQDPIGQHIAFASRTNRWAPSEWYAGKFPEIVGVVADVPTFSQNPEVHPYCYSPYWQYPMQNPIVALRVVGEASTFAPIIRREIKAVDPRLPEPTVQTMDQILAQIVAQPRFQAWTLSVFGAIALALAALGLYGVLACAVTQRQREIGVRMALGAQRRDVLNLIVGQGMRLVALGAALGLFGSLTLTRVLRNLLFEVKPSDPFTLAAVTLLLVLVAWLACYLPARRAANADSMAALRYE